MENRKPRACAIMGLVSLCVSAGALAQQAQARPDSGPQHLAAAGAPAELQEVVVTGYRKSLEDATSAKRDSITFTDSVFAEDIGKFPDLNIAESLNRVPGIQLTRDVNG
ncbi:MAG TPA: hypothetical protein VGO18_12375, partial [Steroidobacteraceae bacterium]|nr:hypothetical protein [Steroidobacteraceae bacterium]